MTHMHTWRITVLGVIAVAGFTACSKGTSQTAAASSGSAATVAPVSKVNVCDGQFITKAEAADIVGAPIADIKPILPLLEAWLDKKTQGRTQVNMD
jgi:hypothetical protein